MKVLIDARAASAIRLPQESNLYSVYLQWALQNPGVQFTWLVTSQDTAPGLDNVKPVQVPALENSYQSLQKWYKTSLPRYWDEKPDLIIPIHGFISTHVEVPQLMWVLKAPGRHFLEKRFLSRWMYQRKMAAMLKKARGGFVNDNGWGWLSRAGDTLELSNWAMIPPVAVNDIFHRANEAALYDFDYHTGGRPFFTSFVLGKYPGDTMNLMKSFSHFKKRQKTDWKLVLIGDKGADYAELKRAIGSYKYREDVVLLDAIIQEKKIALDLCYALVQGEGQQVPVSLMLMALEQSAAIILPGKAAKTDWLGEVPLYAGSDDVTVVAESMMRVYKDEDLAKQMRTRARALYNQLTAENQAAKSWQHLSAVCGVAAGDYR